MAMRRSNAFRMKLHAMYGFGFMHQAHDLTIGGFGGNFKFGGQGRFFNDQGMIAGNRIGMGQTGEDTFTRVCYLGNFAMHGLGCADNVPAKALTYGLMTEADAKQGDIVVGGSLDQAQANPGMVGVAGAGGNYYTGRL